jgi:adenosylcobinamide kinase/adenosylcobinamide-phosphate guanylyltransferase
MAFARSKTRSRILTVTPVGSDQPLPSTVVDGLQAVPRAGLKTRPYRFLHELSGPARGRPYATSETQSKGPRYSSGFGPKRSALVTGGVRSGKSRFAEELVSRFDRIAYVATSEALDEEMRLRIETHRRRRNTAWLTIEEPRDILPHIQSHAARVDAILVDCITIWLANLLQLDLDDADILEHVDRLASYLAKPATRIVCVTNEVGSGIVPATPLGRRFRDIAGEANQRLARATPLVFLLVSGIPVRVK